MSSIQPEVRERIDELEARVAALEDLVEGGESFESESEFEDLITAYEPSTHVERAVLIGYYLERHLGQDTFTIQDVRDYYDEAKFINPANFSDVLAGGEEKGLMRRAGESDDYQLWELSRDGLTNVREVLDQ